MTNKEYLDVPLPDIPARPLNLFQRINEVRKDVAYVQKNVTIDNKYKAVTHDAVVAVVRDSMIKHGLIVFPSLIASSIHDVLKMDGSRASQFRYEADFDITFLNADDPDDCQVIRLEGHAMDNGDKAPGKATSYAVKSAMLKMFLLETGENEESVFGEKDGLDNTKLGVHLKAIADAKDAVELTEVTAAAISAADAANDKQAIKLIVKAKEAREASMPLPLSDADFDKGMAVWVKAVESGKKTPDDILAALNSKRWLPSAEQEAKIKALGKEQQ